MKKGWEIRRLGDACEWITQGPNPKYDKTGHEDFRVLKTKDLYDHVIHYDSADKISKDVFSIHLRAELKTGDVLLAIVGQGSINKCNVFEYREGKHFIFTRALGLLRPIRQQLDPYFLKYFLHSSTGKEMVDSGIAGTSGQQVVTTTHLKNLRIPVPSLAEQQHIVGILDEAFDGIATAKVNAEKNLQNARALFESHLQSAFSQRGEGWVEKPFEELIESNVIGLTKNSREQGEDKAYPYVKMNNITRDNRFDFSSFTCVDATGEEVSKFSLRDGDFLFNTRNSYELVGKSCIYESDSDDVVLFNNNIMRVRFKCGVDARFVLLAFSSKAVADELNSLKSGTTNVSAIYFKDLKSLPISVPPIEAQQTIVAQLKSLDIETQRLASLYQRKRAALDELKKSLLHQAFSGAL